MDAIVSVTKDWAIGKDGQLLVRNKEDMHRFVELTRGCTCIMGRKTYESFPGGPLKGRRNVIITRNASYVLPNSDDLPEGTTAETVCSPTAAIELTKDDEKVWLIGGDSIYRALLNQCQGVYVTMNHTVTEAPDAFFQNLDESDDWTLAERQGAGTTKAGIPFEFLRYEMVVR